MVYCIIESLWHKETGTSDNCMNKDTPGDCEQDQKMVP